MKAEKPNKPEMELLNSMIDEELRQEEDGGLKDAVKRKAEHLYPLLSLLGTRNLDNDEIKKRIKLLIEGE